MMQQQPQQQGMMGTHAGMANQAVMANPGQTEKETVCCRARLKIQLEFLNTHTLTHTYAL